MIGPRRLFNKFVDWNDGSIMQDAELRKRPTKIKLVIQAPAQARKK